jgi:lipoprotein NlpI
MKASLLALVALLATTNISNAAGYQDFNSGISARNRGDTGSAIAAFTRALNSVDLPGHLKAVAFFDRGDAHLDRREYDAAIADFTSALGLRPDFVEAYLARAQALGARKKFAEAIDDDTNAIRIKPGYLGGYLQRMSVYGELQDIGHQLNDCNAMLQMWPKDAGLLVVRSSVYLREGQYDAAIADVSAAIDAEPKYGDAFGLRGEIRELKGDLGGALDDFDDEIDLESDDAFAKYSKGFVQWNQGRFERATSSFDQSLKLNPSLTIAMLGLAISQAKIKSGSGDSLDEYSKALDTKKWPGAIVEVYLGKSTPDQLQQASRQGDAPDIKGQICQANFYLGEWQLAHNDVASAKVSLALAAGSCPPDFVELRAATIELARLPPGPT